MRSFVCSVRECEASLVKFSIPKLLLKSMTAAGEGERMKLDGCIRLMSLRELPAS